MIGLCMNVLFVDVISNDAWSRSLRFDIAYFNSLKYVIHDDNVYSILNFVLNDENMESDTIAFVKKECSYTEFQKRLYDDCTRPIDPFRKNVIFDDDFSMPVKNDSDAIPI